MPAFNNFNNVPNYQYGYQPGNQWQYQPTTGGNYAWGGGYQNLQSQPQPQQNNDHYVYTDYVSGRAGADAYQMPPNVNKVWLFDNDTNRFYVKTYDNNGRPRVMEDNDFSPHVDPEPTINNTPQIDLSPYATKADLEQMFNNVVKNIQIPNLTNYVTQNDLDRELSGLSVGNGGRIVRANESNA